MRFDVLVGSFLSLMFFLIVVALLKGIEINVEPITSVSNVLTKHEMMITGIVEYLGKVQGKGLLPRPDDLEKPTATEIPKGKK